MDGKTAKSTAARSSVATRMQTSEGRQIDAVSWIDDTNGVLRVLVNIDILPAFVFTMVPLASWEHRRSCDGDEPRRAIFATTWNAMILEHLAYGIDDAPGSAGFSPTQ